MIIIIILFILLIALIVRNINTHYDQHELNEQHETHDTISIEINKEYERLPKTDNTDYFLDLFSLAQYKLNQSLEEVGRTSISKNEMNVFLDSKSKFDESYISDYFKIYLKENFEKIERAVNQYSDLIDLYDQHIENIEMLLNIEEFINQDNTASTYSVFSNNQKYERQLLLDELTVIKSKKESLEEVVYLEINIRYSSPGGRNTYHKKNEYSISKIHRMWPNYASRILASNSFDTNVSRERALMTEGMRYRILRRDNFTCQSCGSKATDNVKLHVDHIYPVSKGGKTVDDNLQVLCQRCNLGKSDKVFDEEVKLELTETPFEIEKNIRTNLSKSNFDIALFKILQIDEYYASIIIRDVELILNFWKLYSFKNIEEFSCSVSRLFQINEKDLTSHLLFSIGKYKDNFEIYNRHGNSLQTTLVYKLSNRKEVAKFILEQETELDKSFVPDNNFVEKLSNYLTKIGHDKHHELLYDLKDLVELELIAGEMNNIYTISAYVEDNDTGDSLKEAVRIIEDNQNSEIIILTDLLGGSVNMDCQHLFGPFY